MHRPTVKWKYLVGLALSEGIPRRSAKAAVVVGSILNLINQGEALALSEEVVALPSGSRRCGCGKATSGQPHQGRARGGVCTRTAPRDGDEPGSQIGRRGFECLLLVLLGTDPIGLLQGGDAEDVKP